MKAAAAQELVAAARAMVARGLSVSTVGNLSCRTAAGMLITPTRTRPDVLQAGDVVEVNHDGLGPDRRSLEWRAHLAIYRARPDVGAVAHTHSPYAVARSFDPQPLALETEERTYFGLDEVHVAPAAPAGSPDLAEAVLAALGERSAVLLARHGVIATGADVHAALDLCAVVEHQAQVAHLRRTAGR